MILFVWGKDYVPNEAIKYGAHLSNTKFADYGFQDGDLIVEVGGSPINEFGDAISKILIDGERELKSDEKIKLSRNLKRLHCNRPVAVKSGVFLVISGFQMLLTP